MYETLPKADGILMAGDLMIDCIKTKMPDVLFDLIPSSKIESGKSVKCGQLVKFGNYGPMLKELNNSTQFLFLSVGKNDLLADPDVCTEAGSQWVKPEKREEANLKVSGAVAERINEILTKVTEDFPNLKVFYISPPPSIKEEKLFNTFRETLKKLPIFKAGVKYIEIQDSLPEQWEIIDEEAEPGSLTLKANRAVMNLVYTEIHPTGGHSFCGTCGGIHDEYCPGADIVKDGPSKVVLQREQCWFCWGFGHLKESCFVKAGFKKRLVWCPHCGTSPDQLLHHPDHCLARFKLCDLCSQYGHCTRVHYDTKALRRVYERIGFNLIFKDVVEEPVTQGEVAPPAKKRKGFNSM